MAGQAIGQAPVTSADDEIPIGAKPIDTPPSPGLLARMKQALTSDTAKNLAGAALGPLGMAFTPAMKAVRDYVKANPAWIAANVAGAAVDFMSEGLTLPEHMAMAGGAGGASAGIAQGVKDIANKRLPG